MPGVLQFVDSLIYTIVSDVNEPPVAARRDYRQTGLAGGSVLEKNVLLAGQVGISGHLTIHDNAVIYAQSGIGGDVAEGAVMSGSPAFEAREWLRAITAFQKLPELLKAVRQLERRVRSTEEPAKN